MALTILDPDVFGKEYLSEAWQAYLDTDRDPANGEWYTNSPTNDNMGLYGGLTDQNLGYSFDTSNETYVPTQSVGQSATTDNTNGLNPNATVKLGFSYQQGTTTQHTVSDAISASVSEAVNVNFEVASSTTTFKLQDTLTLTDSTTHSTVTTVDSSVSVPVQVPTGKIYKTILYYTEEKLTVPFTMQVGVTGNSETWFDDRVQGHYNHVSDIGDLVLVMVNNDIPTDPDQYSAGFSPLSEGFITLTGNANIYAGGAYTIKTIDVTPSTATTIAERDALIAEAEANGIGAEVRLRNMGESHRGTIYDDVIVGGTGNDHLDLLGGNDVVQGRSGMDRIEALHGGRNLLHGGGGNDHITVVSDQRYNELHGGKGDDVLQANAQASILEGGAGDDRYTLGPDARGSVIDDADGSNQLAIVADTALSYARFGDDLRIHPGDGQDPTDDIVWRGFFLGDNQVNGKTGAELLQLPSGPTPGDAADWQDFLTDVSATYAATGTWAPLGYGGEPVASIRCHGVNVFIGDAGDDLLLGTTGKDRLLGHAGDDRLVGGAGNDVYRGGASDDTHVFTADAHGSVDRVLGFVDGVDHLEFDGFGPDFDTADEIIAAATQVRDNVRILLPSEPGSTETAAIWVDHFDLADLNASDFALIA
jgi:Ca2+-binding RTX toxin-like protein